MIYETDALRDPIKTNARANPNTIIDRIRSLNKYIKKD